MAHDLVIRNGLIVDGLGNEPKHGDLAIDGDTISDVGEVAGRGRDEIDAEGHAVTPGFVDLHTHFDAQAGWDPLLTPASWHGVTTALFGNCGVTFAPCKPADRDFLAGMMETVEDIPKDAILNGLAWDWVSYGEYLDSIEKLAPAINIIGLVGHCASRFYVMGERAIDGQPTEDETRQIAELVGNSVKEGAIGFSSNRLPAHVLPDGRSIPGTFAESAELAAIARAVGKHNGILQFVLNYANLDEEMALITEQGRNAGTRVLFSAPMVPSANGKSGYADAIAKMRAEGVDVSGLTLPRSGGFVSSLKSGTLLPAVEWKKLRAMDFEGRLEAIRDEAFRAELVEERGASRSSRPWRRTATGWVTKTGPPTRAAPRRASRAWRARRASTRSRPGSATCSKRTARRSSTCGSSTWTSRRCLPSYPRNGCCRASVTPARTSAKSWIPAGRASCSRIGIASMACSPSRKRCAR